uniref:Uncharacterized protein n=1 Tax=Acrobeloides nanus TaxID=290746 RepID=A0A914DBX3_9BILA
NRNKVKVINRIDGRISGKGYDDYLFLYYN